MIKLDECAEFIIFTLNNNRNIFLQRFQLINYNNRKLLLFNKEIRTCLFTPLFY